MPTTAAIALEPGRRMAGENKQTTLKLVRATDFINGQSFIKSLLVAGGKYNYIVSHPKDNKIKCRCRVSLRCFTLAGICVYRCGGVSFNYCPEVFAKRAALLAMTSASGLGVPTMPDDLPVVVVVEGDALV